MIGTGYVGLVTGACLAEIGNDVWCVDVDGSKIEALRGGRIPIYEPGLDVIVGRNVEQGRLRFTTDLKEALDESLFVIIAVGTPPDSCGGADLSCVFSVARTVGELMDGYRLVVAKSTVPVGTTEKIKETIREALEGRNRGDIGFDVAFCPEFLKEGSAVEDFMRPDRVICGTETERAAGLLRELFSFFTFREDRMLFMSIPSAELTKYASNAMLATRISFMNELARFCEKTGADITQIRRGMGVSARPSSTPGSATAAPVSLKTSRPLSTPAGRRARPFPSLRPSKPSIAGSGAGFSTRSAATTTEIWPAGPSLSGG